MTPFSYHAIKLPLAVADRALRSAVREPFDSSLKDLLKTGEIDVKPRNDKDNDKDMDVADVEAWLAAEYPQWGNVRLSQGEMEDMQE